MVCCRSTCSATNLQVQWFTTRRCANLHAVVYLFARSGDLTANRALLLKPMKAPQLRSKVPTSQSPPLTHRDGRVGKTCSHTGQDLRHPKTAALPTRCTRRPPQLSDSSLRPQGMGYSPSERGKTQQGDIWCCVTVTAKRVGVRISHRHRKKDVWKLAFPPA
jgi:hypothetical protein